MIAEIQNALARLGALHLQEDDRTLPMERLGGEILRPEVAVRVEMDVAGRRHGRVPRLEPPPLALDHADFRIVDGVAEHRSGEGDFAGGQGHALAGHIRAGLAAMHGDIDAMIFEDAFELLDVGQRDVGTGLRVVQAPVRIFLDQTNGAGGLRLRHDWTKYVIKLEEPESRETGLVLRIAAGRQTPSVVSRRTVYRLP